jgi:hypothetical protein
MLPFVASQRAIRCPPPPLDIPSGRPVTCLGEIPHTFKSENKQSWKFLQDDDYNIKIKNGYSDKRKHEVCNMYVCRPVFLLIVLMYHLVQLDV